MSDKEDFAEHVSFQRQKDDIQSLLKHVDKLYEEFYVIMDSGTTAEKLQAVEKMMEFEDLVKGIYQARLAKDMGAQKKLQDLEEKIEKESHENLAKEVRDVLAKHKKKLQKMTPEDALPKKPKKAKKPRKRP